MPTWLVTGGAGFIGGNFVLEAVRQGVRVINLDVLTYAGNLDTLQSIQGDPNHVFVHGDIGDAELVESLLREHRPDAVINFAAESHVDRSIDGPAAFVQTNVVGTLTLLEKTRDYWKGWTKRVVPRSASCMSRPTRSTARWARRASSPSSRRSRRTRRTPRRRPRRTTWCARSTTPTACRS